MAGFCNNAKFSASDASVLTAANDNRYFQWFIGIETPFIQ